MFGDCDIQIRKRIDCILFILRKGGVSNSIFWPVASFLSISIMAVFDLVLATKLIHLLFAASWLYCIYLLYLLKKEIEKKLDHKRWNRQ